jgi:diketogulonate reductase-like aldo/keto reductase
MEYVDLYLVHWPVPSKYKDTWRALEDLYEQKVVRAIGVSNFQTHHLNDLLTDAHVVPAIDQVEFHPMLSQPALREYCLSKGITVEAWSPLMHGGEVLTHEVVMSIANKYNKTPAQVVLRWDVQQNVIVIPKSVTPERIRENIAIFDFELTDDEIQAISDLDIGKRIGPDPDNFDF